MRGLWSGLVAACLISASGPSALAQKAGAVFDKPASTKIFGKDDAPKVTCTAYADVTVREVQDGPTSEKAMLLRGGAMPCGAKAPAGAITLETEGLYLLGRKGDHLVFTALDAHGAADFVVIDARTGKSVLKDATTGTPEFKAASAAGGATTLFYRRGINAPCSLLNSGGRCWGSLVEDGKIPDSLASPMPNPSICAASYKKEKSPKDNPSIIAFDVETIIDAAGKATTVGKGKVACLPMP
ncbi:MAG: hypothetical protein U1E19_04080 [Rhodoblastus sp.]